jgi:putative acetyltransferase
MIDIRKTDSTHPDFIRLVRLLDAFLGQRDGSLHSFYHQYNTITDIRHVLLAYEEGRSVGCGAIKVFDDHTMEVKRMFVVPECRMKGIASLVLRELENWTRELGYSRCILETGKGQPEAIALYRKRGYLLIPNYGQYATIENSVCFEKALS